MIPGGAEANLDGHRMWTPATRAQHTRGHLRYASDLTDAEWAVLEPLFPAARATGRPPTPLRRVLEAIFYVLRGGIPWRMLPKEFPPHQTVFGWFAAWRDDGTWEAVNHHLVMLDRERVGRGASPTGAVLDSQSVKTTEAGGPRGFDAGKKVKGRKRHALSDTDGRLLAVLLTPACVQDRDGAVPLLKLSRRSFPFVQLAWADSAYAGERPAMATPVDVAIVRKAPDQVGFVVHARRWVIERLFGWLGRNRRLARDVEATLASATAFVYAASAMLLVHRLGRC
jgi:transposase